MKARVSAASPLSDLGSRLQTHGFDQLAYSQIEAMRYGPSHINAAQQLETTGGSTTGDD